MKKIIGVIVVFLLCFSIYAGSANDLALMVGSGSFFSPSEGVSFSYGVSVGLTKRIDMSAVFLSELTPHPFSRNMVMVELSTTLMGDRNTESKVAGVCVNSLLSVGGFYRFDNKGAGVYLGLTPLSLGSPITSRRERGLRTNVGYDFVNNKVIVTFSPLDIEIYLIGTYRDWF